jgi:hypothetical protein
MLATDRSFCYPSATSATGDSAVANITRIGRERYCRRQTDRVAVSLSARLTWKDASGAVRFASVVAKDVSDTGVFVECEVPATIPLHRLVTLQFERSATEMSALPKQLRDARVLSAVWRVGPCRRSTGTPSGYALRFLVDAEAVVRVRTPQLVEPAIAVAS